MFLVFWALSLGLPTTAVATDNSNCCTTTIFRRLVVIRKVLRARVIEKVHLEKEVRIDEHVFEHRVTGLVRRTVILYHAQPFIVVSIKLFVLDLHGKLTAIVGNHVKCSRTQRLDLKVAIVHQVNQIVGQFCKQKEQIVNKVTSYKPILYSFAERSVPVIQRRL